MAIEYFLSTNIDSIQSARSMLLNRFRLAPTTVKSEKNFKGMDLLDIDMDVTKGFTINISVSKNLIKYNNIKFNYNSFIIFRYNKEYNDPINQKENMLQIVLELIMYYRSNCFLTFNGDNLILYKDERGIAINKFGGFWNNKVEDVLSGTSYIVINENKEFDLSLVK